MLLDYTQMTELKAELEKCQKTIQKILNSDIFYDEVENDAQKEKIAVYSLTSDRFEMFEASLKSLFFNSDVDKVIMITDDKKPAPILPKEVETMILKEPPSFLKPDGPNMNNKFTIMCLIRLGFHEMFKQYDKILSLDYDTIVRRDISSLWDTPLGNKYYLAAVAEPNRTRGSIYGYFPKANFICHSSVRFKKVTYINGGVLLMNLKKLRDDGTGDEMIEMLNEDMFLFPEQDILNACCHRNIYLLDPDYNSCRVTEETVNPKIIHYATMEKKMDYEDVAFYNALSWDEVKRHRELNYKKSLTI